MNEAEKAYQYFVIAVPENEEQAKAYFWARKALRITLTPPNEWVSVEERLPESQADVLVVAFWHENWQTMIGWHSDMGKKWRIITPHGEREPGGVTHWMPLPAPPDRRPPEGGKVT